MSNTMARREAVLAILLLCIGAMTISAEQSGSIQASASTVALLLES